MSLHTLSVLVENKPGVLARVSGLFARRGFNIDSLAVGETEDPKVSRMTIVVHVDGKPLEQVTKQLHKLINVLKIAELPHNRSVERELALIKVAAGPTDRGIVREITDMFRARVSDVDDAAMTIEVSGSTDRISALEELLVPFGIVEIARTGRIALARGSGGLKPPVLTPVPVVSQVS